MVIFTSPYDSAHNHTNTQIYSTGPYFTITRLHIAEPYHNSTLHFYHNHVKLCHYTAEPNFTTTLQVIA
jgi:hypothetical protein